MSIIGTMLSKLGVDLSPARTTQLDMALKAMRIKMEGEMRARWSKPKYEYLDLGKGKNTHRVRTHAKRTSDGKFIRPFVEVPVLYARPIHYRGRGAEARIRARAA